jgi:branched-chain amino acid transport system substrate-binding protein
MAPFSGLAAAFGQDMLKGGQMALDAANGAGSAGGQRVLFDQADGRGEATAAPAAAKKLAADGVAAVIGPALSGPALAAASVFNDSKIPAVTPSANDPRLTEQGLPFVFRAAGRWDQEPAALADQLKAPKVALVADGSGYGQALAAAVRRALPSPPVDDEMVEAGTKDFAALAAKLKAQAPGVVFYAGYAAEGGALAKALRVAGVQASLLMGDAAQDQVLIANGGAAVEGLTFAYPPDPRQGTLAQAYKRRYGTAASLYALSTYDATRLVVDALRRAGGGGDALRQALAATSGFDGAYWGAMGFDAKGDLRSQTYVAWTVRGGRFSPLAGSQ